MHPDIDRISSFFKFCENNMNSNEFQAGNQSELKEIFGNKVEQNRNKTI